MYKLGHSFSQKCKRSKTRPRDLHIRKVSFSGSSLSSGCSLSSSASTSTAYTMPSTPRYTQGASPPPRLHERAYLGRSHTESTGTFFYDDDEDDEEPRGAEDSDEEWDGEEVKEIIEMDEGTFEMEMPSYGSVHDTSDPPDYFYYQVAAAAKRPPMPRSHWSTSTIQTLNTINNDDEDNVSEDDTTIVVADDEDEEDMTTPVIIDAPLNFSWKRSTTVPIVPTRTESKRPPLRAMNSVEDMLKRGGWKRKGIVFKQEEVSSPFDACTI